MDFEHDKIPGLNLPQPSGVGGSIHPSRPLDQQATAVPVATPQISDDESDALDQEWVNKVKSIVEATKSDPYRLSTEFSRAKSDYLRIRHNKHIKVSEDK
jgi:hypothetical protein